MNPIKVYVNKTDRNKYRQLLAEFDKEKSMLGSDVDKDGRFYLIVDLDNSKLLQIFRRRHDI